MITSHIAWVQRVLRNVTVGLIASWLYSIKSDIMADNSLNHNFFFRIMWMAMRAHIGTRIRRDSVWNAQHSVKSVRSTPLVKERDELRTVEKARNRRKQRKVYVKLGPKLMFSVLLLKHVFKLVRSWIEMTTFPYSARDRPSMQPAVVSHSPSLYKCQSQVYQVNTVKYSKIAMVL